MKVAVVGLDTAPVREALKQSGITPERKRPDVVISFGGDGTILYSERLYPGIPKAVIRHNRACATCETHDIPAVLRQLSEKAYTIRELVKLEAAANNKTLTAMNEIHVYHKNPTQAIRLRLAINGTTKQNTVMGDGILVATPYGSTGYFNAITRKTFSAGLGIAFNNSRLPLQSLFLSDDATVAITVLRENGLVIADNNEKMIPVGEGDTVTIRKSAQVARLITFRSAGRK